MIRISSKMQYAIRCIVVSLGLIMEMFVFSFVDLNPNIYPKILNAFLLDMVKYDEINHSLTNFLIQKTNLW